MEEGEQSNTVSAAFPRPPPFYEHFTPQNIARLQELRTEDAEHNQSTAPPLWQGEPTSLDSLPPELRFLIPPPPPESGKYRSFGEERDINSTLPSLPEGIDQLFPDNLQQSDRAHQLIKISKSLLLNFLELVGMLAANPDLARPKIDDLRTLFFNAHQLVNEYRPHQARETLIAMMEERLAQKRTEVEDVKTMRGKVDKLLADARELKQENGDGVTVDGQVRQRGEISESQREEERRVWSALNGIET